MNTKLEVGPVCHHLSIWLVNVTDPLPTDEGSRPHRTGLLAQELVRRGHDVTWWTSSFDHVNRVQREAGTRNVVQGRGTLRIVIVPGPGYRRNLSLSRLLDHTVVARRFVRLARAADPPDLLLTSLPTLELSGATRRLAHSFSRPYLVDGRDLWPDIFVRALPRALRPFSAWLFWPHRRLARRVCRDASGIIGPTDPFVAWFLEYAGRKKSADDLVVPLGYAPISDGDGASDDTLQFWRDRGLTDGDLCVSFVGTLTATSEFESTFEAASILAQNYPRLRFVICGIGAGIDDVRQRSTNAPNVLVAGWVDQMAAQELLRRSVAGLVPYTPTFDFRMSVPNKVAEYLAAGVPVVTSLEDSEVERLLLEHKCGRTYPFRDGAALAATLRSLLDMSVEERSQLRQRCIAAYRNGFRADVVYSDYADHLEQVADRRHG